MKQFNIKTGGSPVAGNPTGGTKNSRATVQGTVSGKTSLVTDFPANADTQVISPRFHHTVVTPGADQPIGGAQPLDMNSPMVDNQGLHAKNYAVVGPRRILRKPRM